jgi:hypothetical protein
MNIKYKPDIITIKDIQTIVEKHFCLKENALNYYTRLREILLPRQIAHYCCYEIKDMTKWSLVNIGDIIGGKDHATVLNSKNKIQNYIDTKDVFHRILVKIHVNTIKSKIDGIYRAKEQKETMGIGTQRIWEPSRPADENKVLSFTGMAQNPECIHNVAPSLRRAFEEKRNITIKNGGPYRANKPRKSIRHAKRQIWRTIRRNKFTSIM